MKLLINTEWAIFLEDLPAEKQLEFFWAVFDYGNRECSLKCWEKIHTELEKGKIKYFNRLNNLKQYNTERESESVPESVPESVAEREPKSEYKYKTQKRDIREHSSNIWNTRVEPTQEQILEYAAQQDSMAGVGGFAVTQEQAQDFYDYYSGIGWVVPNDAKTPIVDWKPFLRKWVRNPRFNQPTANDDATEADMRFLARRKREREENERKGGK